MTYNYCTLFDSFFLSRGLALYQSMKRTTPDFKLYIFPFDKKAEDVLRAMALEDVIIVTQGDFEDDELKKIKSSRTRGEYCWTCTPVIIDYCIRVFSLSHCTYLDADLFFFSNANQLVDEMGSNSVLITDHRYSRRYDQSKTSGKYCVQFVTFKNNVAGMSVLTWWKNACIEWCYDRFEDGKFGDQKYLDDWTQRFEGVYDLPNEGAGLAPWNIQQYDLITNNNGLKVKNISTSTEWSIIFYHFHRLRFLSDQEIDLGTFALTEKIKRGIYRPYINQLIANHEILRAFDMKTPVQPYSTKSALPIPLHRLARRILGVYNISHLNRFN